MPTLARPPDRCATGDPSTARASSRRSQSERKAETRARLLGAAASLFAEQGIDAVSVDAVAGAAGRTSGAVYAHFGSKQGLLLGLLDEWRHALVEVVAAALERASSLEGRLRAVAENVIVDPDESTRRLMALERELWRMARRDGQIASAMRARASDAHIRMTRGFADYRDAGLIQSATDPETMAVAFRAMVVGLEMAQRTDPVLDVDRAAAALALVVA
ncbi:MAG TPA: TetR/AcrR family transcriptional regulator [Acidimicrobiales bacterium]|nr:TetR/AcrR family transcriptional regulator [Acidimicrobiales bacterium]